MSLSHAGFFNFLDSAERYASFPRYLMTSPVWFVTTSKITFRPNFLAHLENSAMSAFVPKCGSTLRKSTPQYPWYPEPAPIASCCVTTGVNQTAVNPKDLIRANPSSPGSHVPVKPFKSPP